MSTPRLRIPVSLGDLGRRSIPLVAALASLGAPPSLAAPDEAMLGKAEGYPSCTPSFWVEPRCLVAHVSRRDETWKSRKVDRGAKERELDRAPSQPVLRYSYQTLDGGVDEYLSRHRTTGLLLLKGDTILVERYQYDTTPAHRMTSFSMAKTVVAMLVGLAVRDGAIASIDDRVERYVPGLKGTPYGETPIRHLLMMSSGVKFDELYTGTDDLMTLVRLSSLGESAGGVETVLPFRTRERPSGERFHYSSGDTQVLGLVVRAATGKALTDYLSEKIWKPMGAEADASWIVDRGGYEIAYGGLNATLRDYARLGMLLANDGTLDGKEIIPAAWVRAATTPSGRAFEPNGSGMIFGYGYQTWLLPGPGRQFILRGVRAQAIFVDPASKLVLVHTAAGLMGDPGFGELHALWNAAVATLGR